MPRFFVSQDGVEDSEELSGDGDEGDHFGFVVGDELLMEGAELWVAAGGDHGSDEEGGANSGATSANEAAAAPLSRLSGAGGEAGKCGDLAAIESSELGRSAMRVRAMVGPTPGTEDKRSSLARHAGEPRTASSMS